MGVCGHSAQLARASQSSEATVTRLCHKLGFDNYRKFQLALARDVMDQQETETQRSTSPDPLRQALQSVEPTGRKRCAPPSRHSICASCGRR